MRRAYICYLSALLLFGCNGVLASHIPWDSYQIVLGRSLIGGAFLAAVLALRRRPTALFRDRRSLAFLIGSGVFMSASWLFLYEAYQQLNVSLATLSYYTGPVLVMVLAPLVLKERLTARKVLGFAVVLGGMLCLYGADLAAGRWSWGMACGVLSAVSYACMVLLNKKAAGVTGLENSACQLVTAAVVVLAFNLLRGGALPPLTGESLTAVLLLGLVNTGLGCYLYFSAIQDLSAQTVSVCGYLEPLSALFFSALFLGERLTLPQWAGAALILGGAAFAELSRPRPPRPEKEVPDDVHA